MRVEISRRFLAQLLVVVIACGALVPRAFAFDPDPAANSEVRKLLEIGWQTSVKSRPEADQQYATSVRAGGGFAADYSYFLVLLHQKRYTEAMKHSEDLAKSHPKDAYAWRGNMWVATLTKNYQSALAASDKYAAVLATDFAEPEKGTFVRENVAFLGRMYGYYGGPAGEQVKQEERKAAEKQVLERLPADLRPEFEEARDAVIAQFLGLNNTKTDEKEKAVADGEAERKQTLEDLEGQKGKIDEKKEQLKSDVDRADAEFKKEIDELKKQDIPLQNQLIRLQQQYASVEASLATYIAQITTLQNQLRNERDLTRRDQIQRDITFLDLNAVRVRADLNALDSQIVVVASQRQIIANKAAAVQQKFNGQVAQANAAANNLAKQEKRNENVERITKNQKVTGNTSKVSAIGAQATAIGTYQPFPLEQEKLRLLETLK